MHQALEALTTYDGTNGESKRKRVLAALRERLAQPEQEPFAYAYTGIKNNGEYHGPHLVWRPEYMDAMSASMGAMAVPLYTAPPQRQWVGLTDEERNNLWREVVGWGDPSHDDEDLMQAIEAKLKEKNT